MKITEAIESIVLIVTIIGVFVAIYFNRKQLISFKQQLKLNFFADYTRRYQEIMLNLPENISSPEFSFKDLPKEKREKSYRYMRAYIDLCSEEYDLFLSGYLDENVWKNWEEGIKSNFSKKAFQKAWARLHPDNYYYPDFCEWMNEIVVKEKHYRNNAETKE